MATRKKDPRLEVVSFEKGIDPEDLNVVGLDNPEDGVLDDSRCDRPLNASMVESILAYGPIAPVLVCKSEAGTIDVIDGRQRVRAAREANDVLRKKKQPPVKVPYVMLKGDTKQIMGAAITLNEIRQDDDPIEKAERCARFLDLKDDEENALTTEDDAAIAFGVTPTTIRVWLALGNACAGLKKAVRAGRIGVTAAGKIAKLPKPEQPAALEAVLEASNGKPTAAKAERAVRHQKQLDSGEVPEDGFDPPSKRLLRKLAEGADTNLKADVCVTLQWVLGMIPPENVPTLAAAIARLDKPKKQKAVQVEEEDEAA